MENDNNNIPETDKNLHIENINEGNIDFDSLFDDEDISTWGTFDNVKIAGQTMHAK